MSSLIGRHELMRLSEQQSDCELRVSCERCSHVSVAVDGQVDSGTMSLSRLSQEKETRQNDGGWTMSECE